MLKEIKFLVEMCPIYFVLFILLCCCCGENNNNVAAAGTASVAYKTRNFDTQNSYNNDLNYNNYNYNNNNNNNININKTTTKFYQNYSPNSNGCSSDRLVVYKVVLHTYWTRELFPKHYPDWRPPAQWTKTIGRAHDSSFSIYHIGQPASAGVKQFAEIGKTDIFDNQKQQEHTSIRHNENNIFDEFDIPAIMSGSGRNEAKFFVDGNHSLVSLMTRIVPSPDWFIGVDSFQLCIGGSWLDSVTVELDPLDAGTDNGFTFTAPNWPTDPQGVIYHITSRYPGHPAGSFFYPKSKRLPPIATFQFIKLKEYELSEVFNFEEDERKYDMVKTKTHLETEHNHVEMNNELSASIEKERQNEVTVIPIGNTKRERIRARLLAKMNPSINNMTTFEYSNVIPKNDKNALIGNIANNYATMKHSRKRILRPPRDCRVGHWSDWEACSKTCGIGEMHRHRKVIKYAKRGGRPCPPLKESKWCGTAKGCHSPSTYFNWSNT